MGGKHTDTKPTLTLTHNLPQTTLRLRCSAAAAAAAASAAGNWFSYIPATSGLASLPSISVRVCQLWCFSSGPPIYTLFVALRNTRCRCCCCCCCCLATAASSAVGPYETSIQLSPSTIGQQTKEITQPNTVGGITNTDTGNLCASLVARFSLLYLSIFYFLSMSGGGGRLGGHSTDRTGRAASECLGLWALGQRAICIQARKAVSGSSVRPVVSMGYGSFRSQ